MKKQTMISLVLCVALVISLTVNIVLWVTWPKEAAQPPMIDPVDTPTTTTVPKEMTDIETPYGTVKFPAAFSDVHHQATEKDGVYTLSFSYLRGDENMDVFAVHFGDETLGTLIGYVTREDGSDVPFTVSSCEDISDETWTAQEREYFKALMMAINDVIASVEAWETFIG